MKKEKKYRVLSLAGDVGELLLKNGSEIYRVEESACAVASHYGYDCNCFATLTCLIISIEEEDGETNSLVRRVNSRTTNLDKVYKACAMIEKIDNYSMKELKSEVKKLDREITYSNFMDILGHCIVAGFFGTLFGGRILDFFVALLGGLSIGLLTRACNRLDVGSFFVNIICGFAATAIGALGQEFGFVRDMSIPIISALMILVPGVPFVNSMRDIFSGDLVTGISRFFEVIMIGTAIAIGSGIALHIFM